MRSIDLSCVETNDDDRTDCAEIRVLISAALDAEASAAEEATIAEHLESCRDCAGFRDLSAAMNRRVRLRVSDPDPAFVARVMDQAGPVRRIWWSRPVLAWCAIVIAVQSFAPLVLGDADGAPAHVARHVGASAVALSCALLYAAWRPHRANGLLPFVGALAATTLVATMVDTLGGNRSAMAEATHLAEMIGTFVLWLVAGSPGWERVVSLLPRSGSGALRSTR